MDLQLFVTTVQMQELELIPQLFVTTVRLQGLELIPQLSQLFNCRGLN
jgi:hypothetical protein